MGRQRSHRYKMALMLGCEVVAMGTLRKQQGSAESRRQGTIVLLSPSAASLARDLGQAFGPLFRVLYLIFSRGF